MRYNSLIIWLLYVFHKAKKAAKHRGGTTVIEVFRNRNFRKLFCSNWIAHFHQSWVYIKEKRGFLIFGVSALMPFMAVLLVNLLNPLFVSQNLGGEVMIDSFAEVTYSIGGLLAGMLITCLSRKSGPFPYMVFHYILMAIALVLTVVIPQGWSFVLLSAFIGWCNVSTRLIRQTLYRELLPNRVIGKVVSFFRSVGTLIRLLLLVHSNDTNPLV